MTAIIRLGVCGVALTALAGCLDIGGAPDGGGGAASAPAPLGLFGAGYPSAGDPCRRAGETDFTGQFLDDAADLIGCPPGTDPGLIAFSLNATQVAEIDGWNVFSVPRR